MKKIILSAFLCCIPVGVLVGCGGGGGGNGGPANPTATPTPINQNLVVVSLKDEQGAAVDGIVTLAGRRQATISGQTTFIGVANGNQSISAEVNGITTTQNITVVDGTTPVDIVINSSITPTATSTVPPPPF